MKRTRLLRMLCAFAFILLVFFGLILHTGSGTLSAIGWRDIAAVCPLGALEAMLAEKTLIDPADRLRASAILTHHLPLNAFSPKSFSAEEKQWQSTNRKMLEAVDKAAAANWNGPAAPWANALTARAEGGRLPVKELYRWMRNPAEAFLKRHGIRLSTGEEIDRS